MERLTIYRDGALEINCKNCPETKICKSAELTESDCLYFLTERLAEYEDMEEQGLLVRLPCKVGDTIYRCGNPTKKIYEWQIAYVEVYEDETVFVDDSDNTFVEADIGKTVFLTREEAEKALEDA